MLRCRVRLTATLADDYVSIDVSMHLLDEDCSVSTTIISDTDTFKSAGVAQEQTVVVSNVRIAGHSVKDWGSRENSSHGDADGMEACCDAP